MSPSHQPSPDQSESSPDPALYDGRYRENILRGTLVRIIQKQDQRRGTMVQGRVREILTGSSFHPHGIKVRLEDGRVGRVKETFSHHQKSE